MTGWLTKDPTTLTEDVLGGRAAILERCPELAAAHRHIVAFAKMMTTLSGNQLPQWIDAVHAARLPGLSSFADGLRSDLAAVTHALTLPYSNGPTQGSVTKLTALKREMFRRARFDLLRARALLI